MSREVTGNLNPEEVTSQISTSENELGVTVPEFKFQPPALLRVTLVKLVTLSVFVCPCGKEGS